MNSNACLRISQRDFSLDLVKRLKKNITSGSEVENEQFFCIDMYSKSIIYTLRYMRREPLLSEHHTVKMPYYLDRSESCRVYSLSDE